MAKKRARRPGPYDVLLSRYGVLAPHAPMYYSAWGVSDSTFRAEYVEADPLDHREWSSYLGRIQRCRLLWAFFEGSPYSASHAWSREYRRLHGLYAWTRPVANPAYRLGDFWASTLLGGVLDPEAGPGRPVPSAIPIETKNEALRPALATLWRHSNWAVKRRLWCLWGATMGYAPLVLEDDPYRQRVRMQPVHPMHLRDIRMDDVGNVRGYTIQYPREDPEEPGVDGLGNRYLAMYTEVCSRDGEVVTFRTYRNEEPYDWRVYEEGEPEFGSEWSETYGFVPMVMAQHIDVGLDFGWAECQPALAKMAEADDLSSTMTDQGRRTFNSPWAMNAQQPKTKLGPDNPPTDEEYSTTSTTSELPLKRSKMQLLWINEPNLRPFQLVGDMPIEEYGQRLDKMLQEMKEEYPELSLRGVETGDSGRARRIARQAVEKKVNDRLVGYIDPLLRAQKMALSMGGARAGKPAYPGYEGITPESYTSGALDHRVGKMTVFAVDVMDDIEEEQARMTVVRTAKEAGVPVHITMRRLGYTDQEIAEAKSREDKALALQEQAARPAQVSSAPQNRGANPPMDGDRPQFTRPPRPRQEANNGG